MKCAVFASGGGTNFQSLINRRKAGQLHVEFALLVCNNSNAYALQRARTHSIESAHIAPSHFENEERYTARLLDLLTKHEIELIVLAGYMKKLPPPIVNAYEHRIVNIHPALLPAFGGKGLYGIRVHKAVLEYGAKVTGVTVHFVDEEYDHGPVIMQKVVEVRDEDTPESLQKRVLELEHDTYWQAIELIASKKIKVKNRRVLFSER